MKTPASNHSENWKFIQIQVDKSPPFTRSLDEFSPPWKSWMKFPNKKDGEATSRWKQDASK